jgi:hypothetical protein
MDIQITSRDVTTSEQKLLYLILMELKEISGKLTSKEEEITTKTTAKTCKYCGGIHENAGQYSACARKHKKEGINNDNSVH